MVRKLVLSIISLVLMSGGFIGYVYYSKNQLQLEKIEITEKSGIVHSQLTSISEDLNRVAYDLIFLANHHEIKQIFSGKHETAISDLAKDYLSFSASVRKYEQIRLLNTEGQEIVRINFNKGNPQIVSKKNLQNKKDRYYFDKTFNLNKGEIYISPLDLNIDRGKIEFPLQPVIRFGTPIFDEKAKKRGIVLLNYFGDNILNKLRKSSNKEQNEISLVNKDGYWLLSQHPNKEWGFMFKNKKHNRFSLIYPKEWKKIVKEQSGQFYTTNGLFTFSTVFPVETVNRVFNTSYSRLSSKLGSEQEDHFWVIISRIPSELLSYKTNKIIWEFLLVYIADIIIIVAICLFVFVEWRQRREIEENLKISEERYRVLIELSPDALFVHNGGEILYCNPKALEVFGAKSFKDMSVISVNELVHPDSREMVQKRIQLGMAGEKLPRVEEKLITLDQKIIHAEVKGEPIIYHNQNAILLIIIDITERKKSEETQKLNEKLKLSNQNLLSLNQTKDELISLVSHELRTPIVSIMGYAEAMIECAVSPEQQNKFLTTIIEESERLSRLIKNFLDVTKYSTGIFDFKFTEENFNQLLSKTIEILQGLANGKNVSIENRVPPLDFIGDGERITQVLLNLIGNSIKFSPSGGTIFIEAERNDTHFKISIEDEGGGISTNELDKVFDKFHQTDRDHGIGGAGLGLYISKLIIEGHKGIIAAKNKNKGALFQFTLPYDQPS